MKTKILALFMVLSFASFGQQITIDTIIHVPVISKDSIYDAVEKWLALNIVDARSAIELGSKSSHTLVVNPVMNLEYKVIGITTTYGIKYKMIISIKEGRLKIVTSDHIMITGTNSSGTAIINDPIYDDGPNKGFSKKIWARFRNEIKAKAVNNVDQIRQHIINNKIDNW